MAAFAHRPPTSPAEITEWTAFDPAAIDRAVEAGRIVLVDVSAAWCLTCKLNELSTLDRDDTLRHLTDSATLRMRADWSRPDPEIAAYLQRFGRFGIPFDTVYGPARPSGEPLPELLTPAILSAAIDRAAGARRTASASP